MEFNPILTLSGIISPIIAIALAIINIRYRRKTRQRHWMKNTPEIIQDVHKVLWSWSRGLLKSSPRILIAQAKESEDYDRASSIGYLIVDGDEWDRIWNSEEFLFVYDHISSAGLRKINRKANELTKKVENYERNYSNKPIQDWMEEQIVEAEEELREISEELAELGLSFSQGF